MSQITHAAVSIADQMRSHLIIGLTALLAMAATVAVVLALAIDGTTSSTSAADQPVPAVSHAGPDESRVAAAIGGGSTTGPDESRVAAAIGAR